MDAVTEGQGGVVDQRVSSIRTGDRWVDTDGDLWYVVKTDDGPRLRLSGLYGGQPVSHAAVRTPEYVQSEYGPLRLRYRGGREVLDLVNLRTPNG